MSSPPAQTSPHNSSPALIPEASSAWRGWPTILLIATGLLLFCFGLGHYGLLDPDEPLYGETAREMIVLGDWLSPHMNFKPWFDKPIFFYWQMIVAFKLFGINEFGARFWSAILGIGGLLLVYRFSLLLFGSRRQALLSGLILATSLEYVIMARASVTDMTLTFFLTFALFSFWWGMTRPEGRRAYWGLYLFSGLATLTKGPLGVLLPFGTIGIYLLLTRRLAEIKRMRPIGGGLLFLAVSVPWYAGMYLLHGVEFGNTFLVQYNLGRFIKPEHVHQPYLYYVPILLLGLLPWGFFLPVVLYRMARRWRESSILFLLVWFSFVLLFFTVAESKLPSYILPLFPAAAMLLAFAWEEARERKRDRSFFISALGVPLVGVAFFVLPYLSTRLSLRYPSAVNRSWILGAVLFAIGSAVAFRLARGRWNAAFFSQVAMMGLFIPTILLLIMPEVERYVSTKAIATQVVLEGKGEVASYRYYRPSMTFYSMQVVRRLDQEDALAQFLDSPRRVYCFIREEELKAFQGSHPEVSLHRVKEDAGLVLISNRG
ncbi:MAG TPA: glycosyltransferase family 39 protein [Nitrospiria bacterium]|nr:glycosyltransferase family 39 protein [Nitrospiria bacterium]